MVILRDNGDMRDIKKIELSPQKSPIFLWIVGSFLSLLLLGSIVYLSSISLNSVRGARKAYYDQVASMKKKEVEVTIIEGWRREQIAALLEKEGVILADDFSAATEKLEGRLFPDTYRFHPDSKADVVIDKFNRNFQDKTKGLGTISAEILTLASIVEREASNDSERSGIAGVYQNRLKIEMMLEADPTVQYAKDNQDCQVSGVPAEGWSASGGKCQVSDYWQPITRKEIDSIDSPYNTYKNLNLPPSPIASPGIKSIEAAITPEKHQYYYFFHNTDGQIVFSRTLEEHNSNKAKFGVKGRAN